jgi:hypothetical protein
MCVLPRTLVCTIKGRPTSVLCRHQGLGAVRAVSYLSMYGLGADVVSDMQRRPCDTLMHVTNSAHVALLVLWQHERWAAVAPKPMSFG